MSVAHKLTSQRGLMDKAELIEKVSRRERIPSKAAKIVIDTIFDSMRESLETGKGIEIRGLGSFVASEPARQFL